MTTATTSGRLRRSKDIRSDIIYRNVTGLCPICKQRKAVRMTCGDRKCVSIYTIGHVPIYYEVREP